MTMLETVARAIHEDEWGVGTWHSAPSHTRLAAGLRARAAIEAMREPGRALMEAGARAMPGPCVFGGEPEQYDMQHRLIQFDMKREAGSVFTAMIDAALSEGES